MRHINQKVKYLPTPATIAAMKAIIRRENEAKIAGAYNHDGAYVRTPFDMRIVSVHLPGWAPMRD